MADGAVFPVELAKEIVRAFRQLQASGLLGPGVIEAIQKRTPTLTETPLYFTNVSGETIPPYACMQVLGTDEIGPQNYVQCDKPQDTTATAGGYVFNGHRAVDDGKQGITQSGRVQRAIGDGTSIAGDRYQPVVGDWGIEQNDSGPFIMAGEDDIVDDVVRVFVDGGGGGGAEKIYFEIIEIVTSGSITAPNANDRVVASVEVKGIICSGASVQTRDVVQVVDELECFLNEEPEALIGRKGTAVKMVVAIEGTEDEDDECKWVVDGLCCPDEVEPE
jgi:hypothetical protein